MDAHGRSIKSPAAPKVAAVTVGGLKGYNGRRSEVRDRRSEIRRTEDSLRPSFRLCRAYSSERGAYAPAGGQTAEISDQSQISGFRDAAAGAQDSQRKPQTQ